MKNIPEKIYLQIGFEPDENDDYKQLHGVTWSDRRVNDSDLEYEYVENEYPMTKLEVFIAHLPLLLLTLFAIYVAYDLYTM